MPDRLEAYHRRRNFDQTPEPIGAVDGADRADPASLRFVIQKHQARSLHYDLRLEWSGVLRSWAVPKGPSLDPSCKRLAIQTEDHPLEYLNFEGVIPDGEYGGGAMLVWDYGRWQLLPESRLDRGELKFRLYGERLTGAWMLVQLKKEPQHWLLIKEQDQAARAPQQPDILETHPQSALSGRSLDTIQQEGTASVVKAPESQNDAHASIAVLQGAVENSVVAFPSRPPVPTAERQPPEGEEWCHEIKYDGYRTLCLKDGKRVRFQSRNGIDWTERLPHLVRAVQALTPTRLMLDGELVVLNGDGTSNFPQLQSAWRQQPGTIRYFAFDVLHLDRFDVRGCPWERRKSALKELLVEAANGLHYCEHLEGSGRQILEQACRLGAEGIVSKRRNASYPQGRTDAWLKCKCLRSGCFVIGGFKAARDAKTLGSLCLGSWQDDGLHYAGQVGTGFTEAVRDDLWDRLQTLITDATPFINGPQGAALGSPTWVHPTLICEVEYGTTTGGGRLRFPSFRGLAEDASLEDTRPEAQTDEERRDDVAVLPAGDATTATDTVDLATQGCPVNGPRLTHPERIVFPQDGVSKLGLATYYAHIAGWLQPFIQDRPLAVVRCPDGCNQPCFYQKRMTGRTSGVKATTFNDPCHPTSSAQPALVIESLPALLELVQLNAIELHGWNCRTDRLDRPDWIIVDLDPDPSLAFSQVAQAAVQIRELLSDVGLQAFPKTTGKKGMHLVIPIMRRSSWDAVDAFVKKLRQKVLSHWPSRFVANSAKAARRGRIYVDTLRNRFGATTVLPYSARVGERASLSMPIDWSELSGLHASNTFPLQAAVARMQEGHNPWEGFWDVRQSLSRQRIQRW